MCYSRKTVKECRTAGTAQDDGQKPGMRQSAQNTEQGSFIVSSASQLQLTFEICVEQLLQHPGQPFIRPRSINSRLARSKPSSGPSWGTGCVLTQRAKRAMPSSKGTLGEKPSACPMAEISAKLWRISPKRY